LGRFSEYGAPELRTRIGSSPSFNISKPVHDGKKLEKGLRRASQKLLRLREKQEKIFGSRTQKQSSEPDQGKGGMLMRWKKSTGSPLMEKFVAPVPGSVEEPRMRSLVSGRGYE